MKIMFILVAGLIHTCAAAQNIEKSVTIQMHSPDLADTTNVFIAGSHPSLGSWNPSKAKMQNMGNHLWTMKISVNAPTSIEYKFTLGSWGKQAADANGKEFQNFVLNVKNDTLVNHNIFFWTKAETERVITGKITGTVAYHKQVKGDGLQPRDVIVWLPPGYDKSKKKRYPVLYMHDGQNIADPATSSFGVDWKIDEAADSLVKNKLTKPFIVVGIYNTSDRTKEYTPGEGGDAYMKFVVTKLKPMIDSVYRTMPDRKNTLTGGSSAGGLICFMLAWEYSNIFSKAICMSPAFKIQHIDYVKTVLNSKEKRNVFFYIDNGGIGLESQLQPGIDQMMEALKQKGYKERKDYFYLVDPNAIHFESDWAKRIPTAIQLSFSH
jgi:predicted alpha/beta superfamily hydrolase